MRAFTYPDVGATRTPNLPSGYHHSRIRSRIGHGRPAFRAAGEALMSWAVHRRSGLSVEAAGRAAEGIDVTSGLGIGRLRLAIPARVVWTVDDDDRIGFAYGTVTGHPVSGEELLVIEIDEEDDVWFALTVFSRPAAWYTRLAGPLTRIVQSVSMRRYVAAARAIARQAGP